MVKPIDQEMTATEKEFPGGPLVRTLHYQCWGLSELPGRGAKSKLCGKIKSKQTNKIGGKN